MLPEPLPPNQPSMARTAAPRIKPKVLPGKLHWGKEQVVLKHTKTRIPTGNPDFSLTQFDDRSWHLMQVVMLSLIGVFFVLFVAVSIIPPLLSGWSWSLVVWENTPQLIALGVVALLLAVYVVIKKIGWDK